MSVWAQTGKKVFSAPRVDLGSLWWSWRISCCWIAPWDGGQSLRQCEGTWFVIVEVKSRKSVSTDEIDSNRAIWLRCMSYVKGVRNGYLHHEDNVGGWMTNEYTEVKGTENAYDSGRWVGRSINTASKDMPQFKIYGARQDMHTFVLVIERCSLFDLYKFVPFCWPLFV